MTCRIAAAVLLFTAATTFAQPVQPAPQPKRPTPKIDAASGIVEIAFPSDDNPRTAWKVAWAVDTPQKGVKGPFHGLYIREAWFKREGRPWLKVLGDTRVAELFVPYYKSRTNYFDISGGFTSPLPITAEMGQAGQILGNKAVLEVRDRGILWVNEDKDNAPPKMSRGNELVLWAPLKAGWYIYLFQYSFRDDGSIGLRSGSTGHNSPNETHAAHMHNTTWRLDIDLGEQGQDGGVKNSASLVEHKEPPPGQRQNKLFEFTSETPFGGGFEGGEVWKPEKFTHLRISNPAMSAVAGVPIAYDVVPLRSGTARHAEAAKEAFTQKDFWVTAHAGVGPDQRPNEIKVFELPEYVKQRRPVTDANIVVWYTASSLHQPRQEDMAPPGSPRDYGTTLIIWSGFDLLPRNLFQSSPHYGEALVVNQPDPRPAVVKNFVKDFGPEALEKILRDDLKKDYQKIASGPGFTYVLSGTPMKAFINPRVNFLMFVADDLPAASIETLNDYNNRYAIHSRAYVARNGKVVIEVPIGYGGGINVETVRDYFTIAELDYRVLKKHVESQR